jgi:putative aldouronate transport system permease protein
MNRDKSSKKFRKSKYLLLMLLPGFIYYIIFHYIPMYGVIISFKNYNIFDGILKSPWAHNHGFGHFIDLFSSHSFYRVFKNTIILGFLQIVFTLPAPIVLSLSLNEVKDGFWKRTIQTVSYLPHFISAVVICGIVFNLLSTNGIANLVVSLFGGDKIQFLLRPEYFRSIYILTDIWQKAGWNSIIYLAALAAVDVQLYEAAELDGVKRWQRIWHIDIPAIIPTAVILFILNVGSMIGTMSGAGFEKVLLLYNPNTYETADVIGTYVYRRGIIGADFSFSTAVGLFQSLIGFVMIVTANKIANKLSDISLW